MSKCTVNKYFNNFIKIVEKGNTLSLISLKIPLIGLNTPFYCHLLKQSWPYSFIGILTSFDQIYSEWYCQVPSSGKAGF